MTRPGPCPTSEEEILTCAHSQPTNERSCRSMNAALHLRISVRLTGSLPTAPLPGNARSLLVPSRTRICFTRQAFRPQSAKGISSVSDSAMGSKRQKTETGLGAAASTEAAQSMLDFINCAWTPFHAVGEPLKRERHQHHARHVLEQQWNFPALVPTNFYQHALPPWHGSM